MQIVGYDTGLQSEGPALLVSTGGSIQRVSLDQGSKLDFSLGPRRCAGVVDDDVHIRCPNPVAPHCEIHRDTWICARCTGSCLKETMDCHEPHAVYLAAFAPTTIKVGVTKEWRIETRLREQGADQGVQILSVPDGRIARSIETDLTASYPDLIRIDAKIVGMHRTFDVPIWQDTLSNHSIIREFEFDYGFTLEDMPVREVIASGTVHGIKGRILLLSAVGNIFAVDLRDLIGYEVSRDTADRNLQSSFRSFS